MFVYLFFFSFLNFTYAQDSGVPGHIETLETLILAHQQQFELTKKEYFKNSLTESDLKKIGNSNISPLQIASIITSSQSKYLEKLQADDFCSFFSYWINGTIKDIDHNAPFVLLDYESEGKTVSASTSLNAYYNFIAETKCFGLKDAETLFKDDLFASTINNLNFKPPLNMEQCLADFETWTKNKYLPYICRYHEELLKSKKAVADLNVVSDEDFSMRRIINERIRRGRFISDNLSSYSQAYIENLCGFLDSPQKFCSSYLDEHIVTKAKLGEVPQYKVQAICQSITKKEILAAKDFDRCKDKMKESPEMCTHILRKENFSYWPGQNCDELSKALLHSNLSADYIDCPGLVGNDSIITAARVFQHLKPIDYHKDRSACYSNPMGRVLTSFMDFGLPEGWKMNLCYHNPIEGKRQCDLYIPGENPNSKYSEHLVVAQALRRSKGASDSLTCKVLEKKKYKPHLLEFKSGCFILFDETKCTPTECPRTIIYESLTMDNIEYQGVAEYLLEGGLDLKQNHSLKKVLLEAYQTNTKLIKNFTELNFFLGMSPTSIVYGIGCSEDIIPNLKPRATINQCTPISFIIGGVVPPSKDFLLTVHLGVESVNFPRLISWQSIFNALSNYSIAHPNKSWFFYGVK